jgi:hypothetical protein
MLKWPTVLRRETGERSRMAETRKWLDGVTVGRAMRLLLVVFGTTSFGARAGYESTEWGMPLGEVEKLYPRGVMAEGTPEGGSTYVIETHVAGLRAIVIFSFVTDGLFVVSQMFPKPGSKVDLRLLRVPRPSNKEADEIVATLHGVLTKRYGKPRKTESGDIWVGADDAVTLQVEREADSTSVAVVYMGYERK